MTKDILKPYLNKKIKLEIAGRKNCLWGMFEKFDTNLDMLRGETDAIIIQQFSKDNLSFRRLLVPISIIKKID